MIDNLPDREIEGFALDFNLAEPKTNVFRFLLGGKPVVTSDRFRHYIHELCVEYRVPVYVFTNSRLAPVARKFLVSLRDTWEGEFNYSNPVAVVVPDEEVVMWSKRHRLFVFRNWYDVATLDLAMLRISGPAEE